MRSDYNVVLVGIGAVGAEMLKVLDQRQFPINQLKILARSTREEEINGKIYQVTEGRPEEFDGADFVFFAGT
ncbi:MAG TPA: aspartate-semialdehyde dehydrogenase, partial [bacterium]|nr:aspartate-semialdehyde dehydrogenase [bacterium]